MLAEMAKIAVRNIKRRKLRSFLTILGISVGITSILLFVSLGEGLKNLVISSFGDVGNELLVTPGLDRETGEPVKLTEDTLKKIEKIEGVSQAVPRLQGFFYMSYRGKTEPCIVIGVDADIERKIGVETISGRFLRGSDKFSAVIGYKRQNFSDSEVTIKPGRYIILKSPEDEDEYKFRVVGVLGEGAMAGEIFAGGDNAVVVPIETLKRMMKNRDEISQIVVIVESAGDIDRISEEIEKVADVNVISMKKVVRSIGSFFKAVQVFLFAIGSIALIVAGFGIMNTMLMSLLERTREIGVLKAIGARRKDVLMIFLIEAGFLGLTGGVLGTLTGLVVAKAGGYAVSLALTKALHMENATGMVAIISTPLWLIPALIVFSVLSSVIFGLYPAYRASSLNPVEAPRHI